MNAAFGIQTTRDAVPTNSTSTKAAMPNVPAQAVQQPLPTTGQSVLLFPEQPRSQGTPCEVARMLRVRCDALATQQLGLDRLDAFTAIVTQVKNVRDDQKPSVIHLLLAQIPLLPEDTRAEALRNMAVLADSVAPADQTQVYVQVARIGAQLMPGERSTALRSLLIKVDSLAPEVQIALLPELATALSSLPNADAQQTLLARINSLIDKLPAPQKMPAAEALAMVSWLSDEVRLAAFNVALGTVYPDAGPDSHALLTMLAVIIPQLPAAAQAKAFRVVLDLCSNWPTQNAGVIVALRSVAGSLTNTHVGFGPSPREQIAAVDRLVSAAPATLSAPQVDRATAGITHTGFTDTLNTVAQRSPASRASELPGLAARLADLPETQRKDAFAALFRLVLTLPATLRATPLSRLADEICVLPQHDRLAEWTRFMDEAGKLPDRHCSDLLTALCGQVDGLPDAAREQALHSLHAMASRLAMPDASLLHALAGVIACLPEQQRMPAFERMHASLQRLQPKAAGTLAMALAAVLPQLPETRRQVALELLAAACKGLPAKHRTPLLVLLAQALATIPAAALLPSVYALLRQLGVTNDPLAPPPEGSTTAPDTTLVSKDVLKETLRIARAFAAAMPAHERTMVLCAIIAGLETCSQTACAGAVEAVLHVAKRGEIDAWLAVLDCAVPLLLKRPPTVAWIVPQAGMGSFQDIDTLLGPNEGTSIYIRGRSPWFRKPDEAGLVLRLCAILGSAETDVRKHRMLAGATNQSYFYRLATHYRIDEKKLAGFMLPLLLSNLPDDLRVELLTGRAEVEQEQDNVPANGVARTVRFNTCVAMALVVDQKASVHKTLTQLVLRSELPADGKLAVLTGMRHQPPMGSFSALNALAALVKGPWGWPEAAFEAQVKMVSKAALTTSQLHAFLLGSGPTDATKTDGVHKSTALLTALAVDNEAFVFDYTTLILGSALPDEFKVALCGRRADVNNEAEVEACFNAASDETRKVYKHAVQQSTLPDSIKLSLLRYC